MIFLPKKKEILASLLRNYIQNCVNKYGTNIKHKKQLKKIYEFEALNSYYDKLPHDLKKHISKLLLYAYSILLEKGRRLNYSVNLKENYIINSKLIDCIILNLISFSDNISIYELKGNIVIKCKTDKKLKSKIKDVISFYEIKSKTLYLKIEAEKTLKSPIKIKEEWDITDPFSPISLYLN